MGRLGQRLEFDVTVDEVRLLEGFYGSTTLYKFVTDVDDVLLWFSSVKKTPLRLGVRLRIRGTVKRHGEYQGQKETRLTRVHVIKRLDEYGEDKDGDTSFDRMLKEDDPQLYMKFKEK